MGQENITLKTDELIYRTPMKQGANNIPNHILKTQNVKLLNPHLLLLKEKFHRRSEVKQKRKRKKEKYNFLHTSSCL